MNHPCRTRAVVLTIHCLLCCVWATPPARAARQQAPGEGPSCTVEIEEVVTRYTPADNGAGPLWCYGSTVIAREGGNVYVSTIETGKDVPPLCNTRWQLWRRDPSGWRLEQAEKEYRQREPCPVAVFHDGGVFLSVNPSVEPAGTRYGRCQPLVLQFDPDNLGRAPKTHRPAWAKGDDFTDHSYRGLAADGANGELLLLNINARTGAQFVSYRDREGQWHAKGKVEFPIRACYPQVALRNRAAHVLAIGDIVEPVEDWRKLKFEKLQRQWDYVFRRLFYTYSQDIEQAAFGAPIEIDTAEATCGYISNLDLHVDEAGAAHLLYLKRPFQYGFIRDAFFPGRTMTVSLEHVVVKDGQVRSRESLLEVREGSEGLEPSFARFHAGPEDELFVLVAATSIGKSQRRFGNFIARLHPGTDTREFSRIGLAHPFGRFFTNTQRGGSAPSNTIDLFGTADDHPNLRYARLRLQARQD